MASTPTRGKVRERSGFFRKCVSQKVGYATHDEAWTAAEAAMEAGRVSPGCHLTPYECGDCQDWHIRNRVIVPASRQSRAWRTE